MNNNNNNNYQGGQGQQGSCNNNYEAFMLGDSFGVGRRSSSSSGLYSSSQGRGRDSVQDCMLWPGHTHSSGNAAKLAGGNFGSSWDGGSFQLPVFNTQSSTSYAQSRQNHGNRRTEQSQYLQQQPQAFISTPGNGQGESRRPVGIPCQIGPLGTDPSSLIKPMEPVTFRVTAPYPETNERGVRGPVTFRISPEELYGARQ